MKKKIVSLVLAVIMLMSTIIFPAKVEAVTFSDVADDHWAAKYITAMQDSGIINGYEDGTFKPENLVKNGEFIKMVVLCKWDVKPMTDLPEDVHWVTPYADVGDQFIFAKRFYSYEIYEGYISRGDAVRMMWKMYRILNPDVKVDNTEKYIKNYSDESSILGTETRYSFNACIQHGLINGFEDGTLRANDTLTRAQATKLLSILLYK